MHFKTLLSLAAMATLLGGVACKNNTSGPTASTPASNQPVASKTPGPLPDRAFRASLALKDAPTKLRAGQKETVVVRIKNASDVFWWARGGENNDANSNRFYIAVGDRWLQEDGQLVTEMDGRIGIPKDLRPGDEVEVPLTISAPTTPGNYVLEVDLVQEQVSWFHDKGSPTAKTNVTVVR
ncbi:MAG TPA: hypothetical protein VHR36_01190 [Pyrinomonadaceae bacterium]|jgi:hypothetical protein|nr:hypothetical protein [Pyrinomonadaceae bacterium]